LVISLHTPIGALKKDRKKSGMALMTDFVRHTLPAKDRFIPFHTDSFFLTFKSTGSQNEHLDGLPPIGRPKYKCVH